MEKETIEEFRFLLNYRFDSESPNDTFWNQESISGSDESFGYENATAIAYALKELNEWIG